MIESYKIENKGLEELKEYEKRKKKENESFTVGKVLREDFMEPAKLSAYKLAQKMGVPVSRVQDILHNRRRITADTSIRLSMVFPVDDLYFLWVQDSYDLMKAYEKMPKSKRKYHINWDDE